MAPPVLASHTSTAQWQSFEVRMRRRRVDRCLIRAKLALEAGFADDAAAALEEARRLDPYAPELADLDGQVPLASTAVVSEPVREPAFELERPRRSRVAPAAALALTVGGGLLLWGWRASTPQAVDVAVRPQASAPAEVPSLAVAEPAAVTAHPTGTRTAPVPDKPVEPPTAPVSDLPPPAASTPPVTDDTPVVVERQQVPALPRAPRPAPIERVEPPPERVAALTAPLPGLPPAERLTSPSLPNPAVVPPPQPALDPVAPPDTAPRTVATTGSDRVTESPRPEAPRAEPPAAAAPAAAAPAPSPAPADRPDSRALIRSVLAKYESAYSALDASAAREVWPTVDQGSLARAFGSLASQHVSLGRCDITVGVAVAQARCSGTATWRPKVGGGGRTASRQWTFELANASGQWQIVRAQTR